MGATHQLRHRRAGRCELGVSANALYGNGLRQTIVTPNDTALPAYATLNLSVTQRVPISGSKGTNAQFDAINVTDGQYQLRTGTGVSCAEGRLQLP